MVFLKFSDVYNHCADNDSMSGIPSRFANEIVTQGKFKAYTCTINS